MKGKDTITREDIIAVGRQLGKRSRLFSDELIDRFICSCCYCLNQTDTKEDKIING